MALRALLLRQQINAKEAELANLRRKEPDMNKREKDLADAIDEAQTDDDRKALEDLIDEFEKDRDELQKELDELSTEIEKLKQDLKDEEDKQPKPKTATGSDPEPRLDPVTTNPKNRRKDVFHMPNLRYRAFGNMTAEQRTAFVQREDIQDFLQRFRTFFSGDQKRAVTGAELMIPEVMLDLIRQNILEYSKLIRRVHFEHVPGKARQNIMGTIPEAVWTEMCATLNELVFTVNGVEVDGFKVGGVVTVCNSLLDDAPGLLSDLIEGIGASIGIAVDKAILYGTGVKMPMGIATRLAQTAAPSDYPANARPWDDLHTSNVITIPASATGLEIFKAILIAAGNAKGKYSRGNKFWAMNEATYTQLQAAALDINAAGAIVSSMEGTMPVIGGDVVVFGDNIVPDNTIIGGYGDLYLLTERAGTSVGYSDLPLYIQDHTVVKVTARYDGLPVIAEGFVAIGLGGAPTMEMTFAADTANAGGASAKAPAKKS